MPKNKKAKTKQKHKATHKATHKAPKKASKKVAKRSAAGKSRRAIAKRGSAKNKSGASRAAKRRVAAPKKKGASPKAKRSTGKAKATKAPAKSASPAGTKKPAGRLPPRQRHAVERDEGRERVGDPDDKAFVGTDTKVDEAQELGEEFVRSVTSGEEAESEMEEEEAIEEQGGPFVVTSASTEYGFGTDASNPPDAERAPFPQVSPRVSPKTDGEDQDQ